MTSLLKHPVWAMAFRPFYSLAALYGALSVLLWGFGYRGTPELPNFFWHAHEMIWGYAGLVVVAFLLTAVATWTGQPPTRGKALIGLTVFWLLARICVFIPGWGAAAGGVFGTIFFWYAAVCMALPVFRTQNKRNYVAVFAIFVLGGTHLMFHRQLAQFDAQSMLEGLQAGLMMVAGFIGLVGMRIISFFTAKRLNVPQIASPQWVGHASLWLPMIAAMLMAHQILLPLAALAAFAAGIISMVQVYRWWYPAVLKEPMLWILFAGYFFTGLGLSATGLAYWFPSYLSLGIHLIGVGGIGVLTLGMMARTALGHTGNAIYPPPKSVPVAFWLMIAATLVRAFAAFASGTAYTHSIRTSAVLFAAALLVYAWRYIPWLLRPRADGKPG
ncbi:NnrS family protein [Neisseria animalis]|uniref:NnrS protein n=1 Tax=Neisseria animalis TaxID=492 RepID=A0A5P3MR75_NEIAN|nr:NnrS family protein [Neisseria animalis]QEY23575.1 NnrS protein [Neisseria animalis]ROW32720.1 NnrS protein [Neisseria animalis]VEE09253.1 integral membrane protein NnrS [Neisseria animalis]